MIRLLGVELTRLRWRRAVLALVAAAIVIPAIVLVAQAISTRPPSAAELDAVTSRPDVARAITRCEKHPEEYQLDSADACRPTVAGYYSSLRQPLLLDEQLHEGSVVQVVTIVAALMLLAGVTFAGHDWNTGSMSNQLLFETRRSRVWAAKGLAATLVSVVVAAVVLVSFWLALYGLAKHRGLPVQPGLLGDGFDQVARSVALTGALALGGYALTMLLRNTVATLGVVFAVSVAGSIVIALVGGDSASRYQPALNVAAVITNDATYYDSTISCPPPRPRGPVDDCSQEQHIDARDGSIYGGSLLVVLAGLSLVTFRRRDVP